MISFAVILDKTPTPTKLLQSIDEIGLFVDDEDIADKRRQKQVDALKERLIENPFDEHFRKATLLAKEGTAIGAGSEENGKQVRVIAIRRKITSSQFHIVLMLKYSFRTVCLISK